MGRAVALVDPTPAYRRGLAVVLEEAGFRPEAPADLSEWLRSAYGPLILVTIRVEENWALIPADALRAEVPIVALLPSPTPVAYSAALRYGAMGAAPWDAAPEHIVRVLHSASEGLAVLPLEVARSLAKDCWSVAPDWMTTTKVELLRSLAGGITVGALARRAGCSERAMYRRLQGLYGRMGVSNRSEAIVRASRWGLIS
ncbi:MAG: DNA-binding response regulator [Acidimicrobiales bacterium]|nr:DNA-binding response regulator [Chloroflexota bacterium]